LQQSIVELYEQHFERLIALRGASQTLGLFVLWEKNCMDVWENTTGSDGNTTHKFVQFLVVADGQLDVARHNAGFLVVACGVAGKFQDLGAKVFKNSSHVNWGSCTDSGGNSALAQVAGYTANWELQTSFGTAAGALALFLSAPSFSFS
jgi:hypothetical protein